MVILGVGNVLMGDEGVGVHAARALTNEGLSVPVIDGGTGGFNLLSLFEEHREMILIDACMDGAPPGTVRILRPRFASDFPRALGAHDIGLRDLIEAASLLAPLPRIELVTVSIAEMRPMTLDLSPAVASSLPEVVRTVRSLLAARGSG